MRILVKIVTGRVRNCFEIYKPRHVMEIEEEKADSIVDACFATCFHPIVYN